MTTLVDSWRASLPRAWRWTKLARVAAMGTGHTPDRKRPELWENPIVPWVTAADLSTRASSFEPLMTTAQRVSELGIANSAAVLHPAGTVMLCRTASVGLFCEVGRPMATTQAFVTWTPSSKVDSRFLLYVIAAMRPEWDRLAYGSTHLTIYFPDLEDVSIPLPPFEEQRRITDFLDDRIARIDRIIAARREQTASIAGLLNAVVANDCADKSRVPLRRFLASIRTGGTPDESANLAGGLPWYAPGSFTECLALAEPVRTVDPAVAIVFPADTVLLVGVGATAGKVAWLDGRGAGNQQLTCLQPDNEVMSGRFLLHQLNSLRDELRLTASASTLPILNNEVVKAFGVWCPSRPHQDQLVAVWDEALESNRARVAALDRSVALLTEYKTSLITAAVTGELDVTTAGSGIPG